jgi:hypothetical protein
MAHCAKAVDLGLSVTPWDGLRQGDRVVARMCMEAATADMRAKLTRLRAENERLREALRDIINAVDTGNLEMNSPEIGGHDDIPLHAWHEEWLHHARAALSKATGGSHEQG